MIDGNFSIVGGRGEIVAQNVRRVAPGEIGFELLEVKLKLDANGEAEAVIPFVSAQPGMWAVKLGTGDEAPAATFSVTVSSVLGQIVGLPFASNIATATLVSADVPPTQIGTATVGVRPSGPVTVLINSSNASNANKVVMVAVQFTPPVRSLTS